MIVRWAALAMNCKVTETLWRACGFLAQDTGWIPLLETSTPDRDEGILGGSALVSRGRLGAPAV